MKLLFSLLFLAFPVLIYSQITLEEVTRPEDFSISSIRKSPTGEYFVQATNDLQSIYTSTDLQQWTKSSLPEKFTMDEIQFFSDGTPLLQDDSKPHLIRRNDTWSTMNFTGGFGEVQASFIKSDTLFVFQDDAFGYSLNKGETFVTAFTYDESITDHSSHLWKFDHHYILHHTAGASDNLSIFTEAGERVSTTPLNLSIGHFLYNSCGEILIHDRDLYYLLKEQGLVLKSGIAANVHPYLGFSIESMSPDGNYYFRDDNTIYKSPGCGFLWEALDQSEFIRDKENMWISSQGDILLYDRAKDVFFEKTNGSPLWEEHTPDIKYVAISSINEAEGFHQFVGTSNNLFTKDVNNTDWEKVDSTGDYYNAQYAPNGDLYVSQDTVILYSADNGHTFTKIQTPVNEVGLNYFLEVLDNKVILLWNYFGESMYYTLNNGHQWIQATLPTMDQPKFKLVNYDIIFSDYNFRYTIGKINILTNEVTSEELGGFSSLFYAGAVIQDDGTIYFQSRDISGLTQDGLYRYKFGEGLEFLGLFPELEFVNELYSSGIDLYAFDSEHYYLFDGESISTGSYSGLPAQTPKSFFISENEYLYCIIGQHRIFRSTQPLSFPQYITGSVYLNEEQNCAADTTNTKLNHWQIRVEGAGYKRVRITNHEGKYQFTVPHGDFTVSSKPLSDKWDLCETSFAATLDDLHPSVRQDFQALPLSPCAELEIDFSTALLRRCFQNFYSIRVRNTGPESSAGTLLYLVLDPYFEFQGASVPYDITADTVILSFGVLEVNEEVTVKIYFKLSCDAPLGIEHCMSGTLKDENLCGTERSAYTECQENIGSFDPNDKRVFNAEGKEVTRVDKGEYLYYHIRFQNTGTDTAFHVRVVDPLSSKLDLTTFEMLSSSHPYTYELNDAPALEVNFTDILLPDSTTNELASHGFFKFRVKPLPEFEYGTSIPNQAAIFFDFNQPVLTPEVVIQILPVVRTKEPVAYIDFSLSPNPANSMINLTISPGDLARIDSYDIVGAFGQVVSHSTLVSNPVIPVAQISSGMYSVVLKEHGKVIGVRKFVKL